MPDNKIQVVGQIAPDDMTIVWQADEDGNYHPTVPPVIPGVFDQRNIARGVLRWFVTGTRTTTTEADIQGTDIDSLVEVDPASPATVYVMSTSTSDVGANAPQIRLVACDAERRWWVAIVPVNGQTPVEITSVFPFNTFMGTPAVTMAHYIMSADVTTVLNPDAAEPLGDIYIATSNAQTGGVPTDPNTQVAKIPQGGNRFETTAFVMPINYHGGPRDFALYTGSKEMNIFLDVWSFDDHRRSFIEFVLQGQTIYALGTTQAGSGFIILGRAETPTASSLVSMSYTVVAEPITP